MENQLFEEGTIMEIGEKQSFAAKNGGDVVSRVLVLDVETPTGNGGTWHDMKAFTFFNDKADSLDGFHKDEKVRVYFTWKSREYNGRYYHNITGRGIKRLKADKQEKAQTDQLKDFQKEFGQFEMESF